MARNASRIPLLIAASLLAIAILGTLDLLLDSPGRSRLHTIVEVAFIVFCVASAVTFGVSWRRSEGSLVRVRRALEARSEERDAWREKAEATLRGLSESIDAQLSDWGLTPTEREIAFLLLKGYALREAAALCDRSERTVRQHAVSIYRKSGLAGRAELSAFFLEDLLVPGAPPPEPSRGEPPTASP
jgi:DNA-binding CsgD family transcriptional regulator